MNLAKNSFGLLRVHLELEIGWSRALEGGYYRVQNQ